MSSVHVITKDVVALKSMGVAGDGRSLTPKGTMYALREDFALQPEDWVFAGVASTPDLDLVGEVVYPESFEKSLQEFVNTGNVFYEHMYKDPSKVPPGSMLDQRLAIPVMAEIHDGALWVYGVLDKEHTKAQEVWKALNRKDERFATKSIGLSIGARPQGKAKMTVLSDGRVAKVLPDLNLYEVSFTYQPVNQYTWAMALKSMTAGADMPQDEQDPQGAAPADQSPAEAGGAPDAGGAPAPDAGGDVSAPMAGGGDTPANPQPQAGDPAAGAAPAAPGAPGAPAAPGAPGAPGGADDGSGGGADAAPGAPGADPGAGAQGAGGDTPGDPNTQGTNIGDLFGDGDKPGDGDSSDGDDQSMGIVLDKMDNMNEQLQTVLGMVQNIQQNMGQGQTGNTDPSNEADPSATLKSLTAHTDELKDFIQTSNEMLISQLGVIKSLSTQLKAQGEQLAQMSEQVQALRGELSEGVAKSLRAGASQGNTVPVRTAAAAGGLDAVIKSLNGQESGEDGETLDVLMDCFKSFEAAGNLTSVVKQAKHREKVYDRMQERFGLTIPQSKDIFNRIRIRQLG